ncbi:MAG: hypothetical protein O7B26_08930 [Planctomycetota bacterium]|nr:hypothetical protein [Planctomycetota bacterium]
MSSFQEPEEGEELADEEFEVTREEVAEEEPEEFQDDSGNDPRDFRNKFMPYYRYTELRNGVEAQEFTIFGLYAFTPTIAMTYELPAFKYVDASEAVPSFSFRPGPGGPPAGPPIPGFGGNVGPDVNAHQFGMGDLILRAFWKPEFLEWKFDAPNWGPRKGTKMGLSIIPILETTLPTHTDDLLGDDVWVLSPGFAVAVDTPTMGFFAMMNFFDFSTLRDNDEAYVSRFRGRWFLLQPFSKPGPGLLDGWYTMPEFQPIYDFREQRFSLWIGPEVGKIVQADFGTVTFYAKPGWGWNKDSFKSDREFTFETGVRIFF